MNQYIPLPILILCTAISGLAQPVTSGQWTATPFAEGQIIKLSWTYTGQKNIENVSNAVVLKPTSGPRLVAAGKKITVTGTNISVTQKGSGLEILHDKLSVKVSGAFDSTHTRGLRFEMPGKAPWLGGGERATPMVRNGQRIGLYNTPAYGYGEGQENLNFSVPFVMTTAGYGLFFDNPSKGYIDFGKTTPGILEAGFESGKLDVYLIAGNSPGEILAKYTTLTGRQPLPPRWALGNFVSRFGYFSQQHAEEVVAKMKADGFPMDAIIIDLFWFGDSIQQTLGNLDWNRPKWPDPRKMIKDFQNKNIQTILITEPFIVEGTKEYKNAIPHLSTDASGKPYRLTEFYFGKGGLIDIFRRPARDWFWQFYKKQSDIGVAGWWGDLGEPEHHPKDVMHDLADFGAKRKMSANEVHNLYGHIWSQMVFENWTRDYPKNRLFFLNRAGFAGSQRFSIFPWTGDVARNWSGFRAQLPILQSMSLSGVPYIHSDAGGFAATDKADPELYTRWLQLAAYTPVFRPHGSALEGLTPSGSISLPSEPTYWDDKTKERALKTIRDRYQLLPYNYTLAWEHLRLGRSLIRPMVMGNATDTNLLKATDQYMWGSALLVAPVLESGATSRKVYLPEGTWYRLHDLSRADGGQWLEEKITMDRIPVFAKGGSFIPFWDKKEFTSTADYNPADTLTIRYYPGQDTTRYFFYDDDGTTPGASDRPTDNQLIIWSSEKTAKELLIRGSAANWPTGLKRVMKIQVPVGGLKALMGAVDGDKITITLNGVSYATQTITQGGRMDTWANMYWTVDGSGGLMINISIKK